MSSQAITAENLRFLGAIPEKMDALQAKLQDLTARIEQLTSPRPASTIVPVQSLDDEDLGLTKVPYVVVEEQDDTFIATFFDAHISSSGETPYEAVDHVKDMIVATFKRLQKTPAERLGPLPTRQIAVLRDFIEVKR